MKQRHSEIDGLVKLLVNSFKLGFNLPFTIPTMRCPDYILYKKNKIKKCRKRHAEIIVQAYNKTESTFHLLYYGMHIPNIQFEYDQDESILISMIKKSLTKRRRDVNTLLKVKDLKKIVKSTKIIRNKRITVRFSEKEYLMIASKAKRRNLEKSEYVRMELFS